MGGLHFWWPKTTGRMYSEFLSRIAAILLFGGFNFTFFQQFIVGYLGMPRRYHAYPDEFQVLNVMSSAGASGLGLGSLLPVIYLLWSLKRGAIAGPNPWGRFRPRMADGVAAAHGELRGSADLGMWVFLLTEILFFGGLFVAYILYRTWYFDAFAEASRSIAIFWGALNTAVLILSSLTMALGVRAAQTNKRNALVGWLILTMILGAVFLGVKVIEYKEKFEHHHVPGPSFVWAHEGAEGAGEAQAEANAAAGEHRQLSLTPDELHRTTQIFFSLYFTMTGLHALHMIVGIVLTVITIMAWRGKFDAEYYTPVEMSGLYWHFVDIVWIFLFPLLYLVERHA